MKYRGRNRGNAAACALLTAMCCGFGILTVRALDHPGEQFITGDEYKAQIAVHAPRSTAVEQKVELPEKVEMLYDVPLDKELQAHIIRVCEEHHIDPAIVMAMSYRESGFDAEAVGDGGESYGLLQVQPKWHYDRMQALGCTDLLDPYQNVTVAVDYLAEQLDRFDGDIGKALVGYNQYTYNGTLTEYALDVLEMAEELRGDLDA